MRARYFARGVTASSFCLTQVQHQHPRGQNIQSSVLSITGMECVLRWWQDLGADCPGRIRAGLLRVVALTIETTVSNIRDYER